MRKRPGGFSLFWGGSIFIDQGPPNETRPTSSEDAEPPQLPRGISSWFDRGPRPSGQVRSGYYSAEVQDHEGQAKKTDTMQCGLGRTLLRAARRPRPTRAGRDARADSAPCTCQLPAVCPGIGWPHRRRTPATSAHNLGGFAGRRFHRATFRDERPRAHERLRSCARVHSHGRVAACG